MRLQEQFEVRGSRETAIRVVEQDETLEGLFPDTVTEIVDKTRDRKTAVSHYRALGREGDATFHFTFLVDGNVRFEKVCDGNVWRQLSGEMTFEEVDDAHTRVCIEMDGRTKALVPEFTIRGPMQDQIRQMADALKRLIEGGV